MNGVQSPKSIKGLKFTAELLGEIAMVGIEVELSSVTPPVYFDPTLLIRPRLFKTDENITVAVGDPVYPAFVNEAYDNEIGNMAMVFLSGKVRPNIPYTISFEFVGGDVNIFVSEDTHYFHDGYIANDVFAVKG